MLSERAARAAMSCLREPDALIGLVRVCGGPGGQPLGLPGRAVGFILLKWSLQRESVHVSIRSGNRMPSKSRGSGKGILVLPCLSTGTANC